MRVSHWQAEVLSVARCVQDDQSCLYSNGTALNETIYAGRTVVNDTIAILQVVRAQAAKTACVSLDPLCQICANSTTCLYCKEARSHFIRGSSCLQFVLGTQSDPLRMQLILARSVSARCLPCGSVPHCTCCLHATSVICAAAKTLGMAVRGLLSARASRHLPVAVC